MSSTTRNINRFLTPAGIVFLVVFLVIFAGLLIYKVTGHSLGIRRLASSLINISKAVMDNRSVASYRQGKNTDIIFLHHSVGHNLITQGGVRESFTKAGYNFWNHDYNDPGLAGPSGQLVGYSYNVPDDNTDIDGLARIFKQRVYPLPLNTLSGLLQHEVIIFKSCFPNSNIASDDQMVQDKALYLEIRDVMDKHPDKIFIVETTPPLNPAETNLETAVRARSMANWLKSDEYLMGHPNIFTFDFFSYLAEEDPSSPQSNMLKKAYHNGTDSHPNLLANETIGPKFVQFVIESIQSYLLK